VRGDRRHEIQAAVALNASGGIFEIKLAGQRFGYAQIESSFEAALAIITKRREQWTTKTF
jgi:hypothetical protein